MKNKPKLFYLFFVVGFNFLLASLAIALPRYQDNEFRRKDKEVLTLWPTIPFFEGGDIGQYSKTMKQDRDSVRQMFMGELLEALERLADKGGAVELMLEPMANILMMFDQVHDIHKAKDVIGIDRSLEAQFKGSFEELFRRFDIRDSQRKIQLSTGTDQHLLEAYIREISVAQPLGQPIPADELKVQIALELYEQIDFVAYGTFSNLGQGNFQLTFHLSNNKNGTQRSFLARGPLVKALDELVKQVFDYFQKNVYPDWETPFKALEWLPIPINYNKKEGYTWDEANFYCKSRSYRLPFARELIMAESGGAYKRGGIESLDYKISYPVSDRRMGNDHYVLTPGNEAATGGAIQAALYSLPKGSFWCTKGKLAPEVKVFETLWELIRKHLKDREIFQALQTIRYELGDFGADQPLFFDDGRGVERLARLDSIDEAQKILRRKGIRLEIPEALSPVLMDWSVAHTWNPLLPLGFDLFPPPNQIPFYMMIDQIDNSDGNEDNDHGNDNSNENEDGYDDPNDDRYDENNDNENDNENENEGHPPPDEKKKGKGRGKDDSYDRARGSAAAEIGRLIGREAWEKMKKKEKSHLLDTYRDSLRGKMLNRYALDQKSVGPQTYGYMRSVREGRDRDRHYCRELEVDIVAGGVRHYGRSTMCLLKGEEWIPTLPSEIEWIGERGPNPSPPKPNPRDWLPPNPR